MHPKLTISLEMDRWEAKYLADMCMVISETRGSFPGFLDWWEELGFKIRDQMRKNNVPEHEIVS